MCYSPLFSKAYSLTLWQNKGEGSSEKCQADFLLAKELKCDRGGDFSLFTGISQGDKMLKGGKPCPCHGKRSYLPRCKHTPCWVGRCWGSWAMWTPHHWCCEPRCHSRSGWGSGRHGHFGNLKEGKGQRTDRCVVESRISAGVTARQDKWKEGWKVEGEHSHGTSHRRRRGGAADLRKTCTHPLMSDGLWAARINIDGTWKLLKSSSPAVLCARAKPSSIRKKSIHAVKRDITHQLQVTWCCIISLCSTTKTLEISKQAYSECVVWFTAVLISFTLMNSEENTDQYNF